MKSITFVGTGGAFNHEHGNTAALLKFNGSSLLLDCGHDVPKNLEKIIDLEAINNIWISHLHGDHMYGLEELAYKGKYLYNKKFNLIVPYKIYPYLRACLESSLRFGPHAILKIEDYFNIYQVKDSFNISGTFFFVKESNHMETMPSYYLEGPSFIYTADTQFVDWDKEDIKHIKYIFHDTQLQSYEDNVHCTLDELITLSPETKNKIHCMHYGSEIEEKKGVISDNGMKVVYPGDTIDLT